MNCRVQLFAIALAAFSGCTDAGPESTNEVTQSLDSAGYTLLVPPAFGGTFSAQPAGTSCGVNCWTYPSGTTVTVSPTANVDAAFVQWTGDCSGSSPCTVTMSQDHTLSGVFVPLFTLWIPQMTNGSVQWNLAIGQTRGGGGWPQRSGTMIALTAIPDPGATFTGWTGDCSGTGPCTLPMTQDHTVSATFSPVVVSSFPLTVMNSGGGVVTSMPAGINCGAQCSAMFPAGAVVTLTAVPALDYSFVGWTGGPCVGTGACSISMMQAQSITAVFQKNATTHTLTVTNTYGGTTTGPAGVCGNNTTCTWTFAAGTPITLTFTPLRTTSKLFWYYLAGVYGCAWDGANSCTLTMDQDQQVFVDWEYDSYY